MGGAHKPFMALGGGTVLGAALSPFLRLREIVEVVVAAPAAFLRGTPDPRAGVEGLDERIRVVEGGASRFDSVARAFAAARANADVVAVHDGARPFPPDDAIRRCIEAASAGEVAVAGIPVADTLKRAGPAGRGAKTVSREGLWRAQTPQMFPRGVFAEALARCRERGAQPTDDSWMAEAAGESVRMVRASPANFKITDADDVRLAECMLRTRGP